jgi:molybdate transport system ATP-binding protein
LALVPQQALLFPHLSTRANLTFAPGAAAELASPRGRRIVEVLRLEGLLARRAATLSGGERQRIALGRALLARPRLLLLDEPAASLDAELQREVLALLAQSKQELGVAMLFVTHRPAELLALADDCIVLEHGAVVEQGAPIDVLAKAAPRGLGSLVGVDNLLRLPLQRDDAACGTSWLDLGAGQSLCVPWCGGAPGRSIDIGLYAQDVILCKQAPSATSARNALPCHVTALSSIGREVLVTVLAGAQELRVRITAGAAVELGLGVGEAVVALIKTTACHRLDADGG